MRRHLETTQQTRARREADAEAHRLRCQRETLQQTQTRRAADVARLHLAHERQSQGIRSEFKESIWHLQIFAIDFTSKTISDHSSLR